MGTLESDECSPGWGGLLHGVSGMMVWEEAPDEFWPVVLWAVPPQQGDGPCVITNLTLHLLHMTCVFQQASAVGLGGIDFFIPS